MVVRCQSQSRQHSPQSISPVGRGASRQWAQSLSRWLELLQRLPLAEVISGKSGFSQLRTGACSDTTGRSQTCPMVSFPRMIGTFAKLSALQNAVEARPWQTPAAVAAHRSPAAPSWLASTLGRGTVGNRGRLSGLSSPMLSSTLSRSAVARATSAARSGISSSLLQFRRPH